MAKIHSTEVTLPLTDLEVKVKFTFTPRLPGKMYLRNGDPGYPSEPAEVEIDEVLVSSYRMGKVEMINVKEILKKEVLDRIEEELLEIDWVAEDRC
jgi:hypothetical protein